MKANQIDSKILSVIKESDEYSPLRLKGNKFSVKNIKSYVDRKTETTDSNSY